MNRQAGFSVLELVAALFVLSASLVSLGGVFTLVANNWARIHADLDHIDDLQKVIAVKDDAERQRYVPTATPISLRDNGTGWMLSIPRIEQSPDCRYDLVGRQCR